MGQDDRDFRRHREDPHEDPNDGDAGASDAAAGAKGPGERGASAGAGAPADAGERPAPQDRKAPADGESAGEAVKETAAGADEPEAEEADRATADEEAERAGRDGAGNANNAASAANADEADGEDDSAERARIAERLAGARRLDRAPAARKAAAAADTGKAADADDAVKSGESGTAPGGGRSAARETAEAQQAVGVGRLLNGRYRLTSVVGRGGMGTVWEAEDEVLGRRVAVKELRLPPGVDESERKRMITRTLREAKAIAAIRSRGVVTVYDVVDEGSRPWIVMELIEGRSLAEIIRNDGPMSPRRAAGIGLAVLDVLRDAHAAGILHRDVKPSNVIVADEDGRVVLTDFGIAKVEGDPSITSTGMLVGAPSYISPERARGEAPGPPADLWSLGALLYCCVEGRPPYDEGGAIATLAAVMHDPVPPPRHAGALTELVNGLLIKDPAGRLTEAQARALLRRALTAEEEPGEPRPAADKATVVVGLRARRTPDPRRPAPARAQAPATLAAQAPPPPRTPVPPSAEPAPGRGGERARRRTLLLGAAVVVLLALIATVLVVVLGDDEDPADAGGSVGTAQQQTEGQGGAEQEEEGRGEESGDGPAADGDQEDGEHGGQQEGDGSSGATGGEGEQPGPPGTSPETDPSAGLPESPAGYAVVEDEEFHFRISLPQGWQRVGIAGQHSGGIYAAPDGQPPKVQVDFTANPTEDAEEAWRDLEDAVRRSSQDYHLLGIQTVQWRDYPTVADWQFERTEHGQRVRVLDRGFRIDEDHGYAIMITCLADEWDSAECRTLRETAFDTFQPVDSTN